MSNNLPEKTAQTHTLPAKSMADLSSAGEMLAQANFLGCRNKGEGFLVMAACQQRGEDLVSFQQRYHLRQGRFSMQAHEMLAQLEQRGGGYEIIERSPEKASLRLWKDGREYVSELTWEQAKQEPFPYRGNENDQLAELKKPENQRRFKNKYITPRSRMQMLWVRAVSDGVVAIDPGCRGGIYTPEETDDFTNADEGQSEPEPVKEVEVTAEEAEATVTQAEGEKKDELQPEQGNAKKGNGKEAKQEGDKTPWEVIDSKSKDFTVCPLENPKVKGKKWTEMPTAWLEKAAELPSYQLEAGYKSEIEKILKERKDNDNSNN